MKTHKCPYCGKDDAVWDKAIRKFYCRSCDKSIGRNELKEDENMILNPNCSEAVFKLTGSFEQIKDSVLQMLDIVDEDYKKGTNMNDKKDKEWYINFKKRVAEKRKEVEKITTLEEFRMVVFPFTSNYETFFKPDNDDLLVATCNNTDWNGMAQEYIDMDKKGFGYHDIAGYEYYNLLCSGDSWIYISSQEKKSTPIIFKVEHQEQLDKDDNKSIKIIQKKNLYYYVGQKIVEIKRLDKRKLTDDDKRIIVEVDKKLVVKRLE